MRFSEIGQEKLKKIEGFKAQVYKDSEGNPTIGYGHMLKRGENFVAITPAGASKLLLDDIAPIERFLNNYIKPKLNQNQFDALIMFIYNIGETAFLNSSVFSDIQKGDFQEATLPWGKWINITKKVKHPKTGEIVKKLIPVQGLINRRAQEIKLFNT